MENNKHNTQLTSSEIANLWTTYVSGTMMICGIKYFLAKVEDEDVRSVISKALELAELQVSSVKAIFTTENYPIPVGFTDQDVNTGAPRLYSDTFFLIYILNMAKFLMSGNSVMASLSAREDIVNLYSEFLAQSIDLHKVSKKLALEIGVYVRPPYIPKPDQPNFVTKQSFLSGFGHHRPLLGIEISNLVFNCKRNHLGSALSIGFSQVAESKEVRKFMERGRDISKKHIKSFTSKLEKEYLPAPMSWDSEVMKSTVSPFSDKLMMYHIGALSATGIAQYGMAMSMSPRSDLAALYIKLAGEIGFFAEDGTNIMIANGWFEEPPISTDRQKLAKE